MKKISLIIPMVLFITFIASSKAEELCQPQLNDIAAKKKAEELSQPKLNDIAAKMILIYSVLLQDDNPPPPSESQPTLETEPQLPFETNTTEPSIIILG